MIYGSSIPMDGDHTYKWCWNGYGSIPFWRPSWGEDHPPAILVWTEGAYLRLSEKNLSNPPHCASRSCLSTLDISRNRNWCQANFGTLQILLIYDIMILYICFQFGQANVFEGDDQHMELNHWFITVVWVKTLLPWWTIIAGKKIFIPPKMAT